MERAELLRLVFVLGPIVAMLALGAWVTLRSGVVSITSWSGLRLAAQNLSHALCLVAGCLVALVLLQQVVGYRLVLTW